MPKNFKKLLVCIVATFCITSMVFSCCKKVGFCASSETVNDNTSFPLKIGNGYGRSFSFSSSDGDYVAQFIQDWDTNWTWPEVDLIILDEYNDSTGIATFFCYNRFQVTFSPNAESFFIDTSSIQFTTTGDAPYWNAIAVVDYDVNSHTCSNPHWLSITGNTRLTKQTSASTWFDFLGNNTYQFKLNMDLYCYPMWVKDIGSLDGYFTFGDYSGVISGHSKGGVLSNYIDSDDLIEDSSQVPKVDTSAPSNVSSIPDWLQKILNGIGKVNQSIQGGVLTLGDYIGSGFEKVGEWFQHLEDSIGGFFDRVQDSFDDIIDTIEGLKDGSTVAQAQGAWEQEFNNSIFKDFVDLKGSIEDDILTPIRNANAPSSLSFTIPLIKVNVPNLVNNGGSVSTVSNNVFLFGQSVTLDFSWYTRSISGGVFNGSSIRDYLVPIIATFLYVTMVVHLLFKIPSFLNGSSGFSDTLHTVVVSFNGSKFKKA